MTKLEKIESEISSLSDEDFRKLADWIASRRDDLWDRQIEADTAAGKLDALAADALAAHRGGRSRQL